jgi:integrase/recombinase XerC
MTPEAYQITTLNNTDIIQALINDKRSINTRRAYENDLKDFFTTTTGQELNPDIVRQFLNLPKMQANAVILNYKAAMIKKNLSESTINRRLSAIKSLVTYAARIGQCEYKLDDIQGEKTQAYRDTAGINAVQIAKVLSIPDQSTAKGIRDYAILRLLWECALRRGELVKINIGDYNPQEMTVKILGKGKGNQKIIISLSERLCAALNRWLEVRGNGSHDDPLFTAMDNANKGHRITGDAVYFMVSEVSKQAGITKRMSPHRVRHSSITAALESTNGNVIAVKKLSRHAKLETLEIYNDSRENHQRRVSNLLSDLA